MSRLEERKDAPRIFDPNIDRTSKWNEITENEGVGKRPIFRRVAEVVSRIWDIILWPSATPLKIERPSGEGWNAGNSRWN